MLRFGSGERVRVSVSVPLLDSLLLTDLTFSDATNIEINTLFLSSTDSYFPQYLLSPLEATKSDTHVSVLLITGILAKARAHASM